MADVLMLDTCGETGYVAVARVAGTEPEAMSERHLGVRATQEELLPAIAEVLAEAGVLLRELKAVAVVNGPGSFTGVRIGLAAAKGLCEAAGVRLVAISRLQVLADAVSSSAPVWAWLQAGRGQVYTARYGPGKPTGVDGIVSNRDELPVEAGVQSLEAAAAALEREPAAVRLAVCEEGLRAAVPEPTWVTAEALARSLRTTVAEAVRAERWADAALTDALYLRVPDAELALRARQG